MWISDVGSVIIIEIEMALLVSNDCYVLVVLAEFEYHYL